jgi:hypothetical protein
VRLERTIRVLTARLGSVGSEPYLVEEIESDVVVDGGVARVQQQNRQEAPRENRTGISSWQKRQKLTR